MRQQARLLELRDKALGSREAAAEAKAADAAQALAGAHSGARAEVGWGAGERIVCRDGTGGVACKVVVEVHSGGKGGAWGVGRRRGGAREGGRSGTHPLGASALCIAHCVCAPQFMSPYVHVSVLCM